MQLNLKDSWTVKGPCYGQCQSCVKILFEIIIESFSQITYSKGRHEASFHPSILSSIHPSIQSSICPVMVCLLRGGEERVEYRCGAAENNIYQCCKFLFLFFILGFLDLGTLILFLSQQLKELGWAFFLKFYLEFWKFSMFFTLP